MRGKHLNSDEVAIVASMIYAHVPSCGPDDRPPAAVRKAIILIDECRRQTAAYNQAEEDKEVQGG